MIRRAGRSSTAFLAAVTTMLVVTACGSPAPPSTPPQGPSATPAGFGPSSPIALTGPTGPGLPSAPPLPAPSPSGPPAPVGVPAALPRCPVETDRFPPGYTAYHTYASLCRAIVAAAAAHPGIARLQSIGRSWEGRTIWAMEITTHLGDGTHPPGVLFDGLHHGLEHLSLEMTLGIMGWLLDGYGHDPTITRLVETRAVFIVFDVNPDGAAADIAGARFHLWRKDRQPGPGGILGTDLNRNYADHWGCCGLVSSNPGSAYYRGAAPFSSPETQAVRDFVRSHVFNGRQQIRVAITFHASGRLVLWPYGYTTASLPSDMRRDDLAVFVAMGRTMARTNGYRPEQASGLYVDSGTARDWYYGTQGIFAYTFELGTGTYQPSSAIGPEVARNRAAVVYLIGMADCPYRAIDKATQYCG